MLPPARINSISHDIRDLHPGLNLPARLERRAEVRQVPVVGGPGKRRGLSTECCSATVLNMESSSTAVSIARALDVLEALARVGHALGVTDLADRTGLPKPTVHRLLAVLAERGYVARDGDRYMIGIRCFELGSLWAQNLDLRSVAAPQLRRLNEVTGETVHLAIYDHGDVVYIEQLKCLLPVAAVSYVGRRCPAFCVATGRVLLAHQPWRELDEVLGAPLPRFTPDTLTDPAALRELLADARRDGYAVNRGNYREGVAGVAAPIRDHTGAVVAAVGCCLPLDRFGGERFTRLLDETRQAADAISAALGAAPGDAVQPGAGTPSPSTPARGIAASAPGRAAAAPPRP